MTAKVLILMCGVGLALHSWPLTLQATPRQTPLLASGETIQCTIRSIHGQQQPGGIDKRLDFLRKELSKPPFSAFKTLKLLQAKELTIPQGALEQAKLPTGKILKLTFKEKLLERKDKIRLRLYLSITPPKEERFLPGTLFTIANHGTLLVAGDTFQGGTLVVGVTCKTQ